MLRNVLFAAIFAAVLWGGSIQAGEKIYSGLDFDNWCQNLKRERKTDEQMWTSMFCLGYLRGFTEAHDIFNIEKENEYFCAEGVENMMQFMRVFHKWANDNPQKLHFPIARTLGEALASAFPCK